MDKLVSPKQVARAIGVSESSLKRWCDRGLIAQTKTAGGHRKLRVGDVLQFLRENGHQLAEPGLLGLPAMVGRSSRTIQKGREIFRDALIRGDDVAASQLLIDLFAADHTMTAIGDDVIASAFHEIGDLWECGDVFVYEERRSCEICLRALHELRNKIPAPAADAPIAIGAAAQGDIYSIALKTSELVLRSVGWRAEAIGSNLPFDSLAQAIDDTRPRLVWLSVSYVSDEQAFVDGMRDVYEAAVRVNAALALGGQALHESLRHRVQCSAYLESFRQLETFARALHPFSGAITPPPESAPSSITPAT